MNTGVNQRRALLALALLVPAPSIGVALAMLYEPTAGTMVGNATYMASKLWILALPVFWLLVIERGRASWSPPRYGGLGVGALTGVVIGAAIIAAYVLFGRELIDAETARQAAARIGIDAPLRFLALAAYLITINALLEEYVWRWFVYEKCEMLVPRLGGWIAVALSAAFFTAHHVLALAAQFDAIVVVIGSVGVFVGGCVWSALYRRYRSIWPGFISHAIVDVAVFIVGWRIIFG
jgi:uncharacterized protein